MIDRYLKRKIVIGVSDHKLNINIVEITLECSMTNLPRNGQMIEIEAVKDIVECLINKIVNYTRSKDERLDGVIGAFSYRNTMVLKEPIMKEPIKIDVKDAIPTAEYFVWKLNEALKDITPRMVKITKIVVEENTGNSVECVRE